MVLPRLTERAFSGFHTQKGRTVPRLSTKLTGSDLLEHFLVRCGIGRMDYRFEPGLYAVGTPGDESPVVVTANYKLTVDEVRRCLEGMDAWVLVIDTAGINVWCAAGEGRFSAGDVARAVESVGLDEVAPRGQLILPQLSAPSLSLPELRRLTGRKALFGPVRARDLRDFVESGFACPQEKRRVSFSLRERLVLVPVEIKNGLKYLFVGILVALMLSLVHRGGPAWAHFLREWSAASVLLTASFLGGAFLVPLLLPFLPGRAFSFKGLVVGVLISLLWILSLVRGGNPFPTPVSALGWCLIVPAVSSFTAMNFTGATPFTSLSGVVAEMRRYIPVQVLLALAGIILWVGGKLVGGAL
ncbi:MAG: hypothetical protein D6713_00380 [Deltaproteobacteria bacterium]|nr:MAG: hypothetical protein D6713_00380 [Deltaproteobacteria bacterium]